VTRIRGERRRPKRRGWIRFWTFWIFYRGVPWVFRFFWPCHTSSISRESWTIFRKTRWPAGSNSKGGLFPRFSVWLPLRWGFWNRPIWNVLWGMSRFCWSSFQPRCDFGSCRWSRTSAWWGTGGWTRWRGFRRTFRRGHSTRVSVWTWINKTLTLSLERSACSADCRTPGSCWEWDSAVSGLFGFRTGSWSPFMGSGSRTLSFGGTTRSASRPRNLRCSGPWRKPISSRWSFESFLFFLKIIFQLIYPNIFIPNSYAWFPFRAMLGFSNFTPFHWNSHKTKNHVKKIRCNKIMKKTSCNFHRYSVSHSLLDVGIFSRLLRTENIYLTTFRTHSINPLKAVSGFVFLSFPYLKTVLRYAFLPSFVLLHSLRMLVSSPVKMESNLSFLQELLRFSKQSSSRVSSIFFLTIDSWRKEILLFFYSMV